MKITLTKRKEKIEILKVNVGIIMVKVKDFDLMVDEIQQLITKTNVRLLTDELRSIADIYFKLEKSTDRTIQSHRLDLANKIFQEVDHTNSGLIEPFEVDLFYKGVKENDEYQCKKWTKLILKSIEDLDDRKIRQQILQHPFDCDHPVCQQVAKHMRGILK